MHNQRKNIQKGTGKEVEELKCKYIQRKEGVEKGRVSI